MTQRERKLTIVAGGIFAVFLVFMLVQKLVINRISDLRAGIASKVVAHNALQNQIQMETVLRRQWARLTSQTLDPNPSMAVIRLDALIKSLLKDAGLTRFTAGPGDPRASRERAGLIMIPYTVVGAEGDLQSFARFLHSLYQLPYAMQIHGFNLEPTTYRKGQPLHISSIQIETFVLPTDGIPADLLAGAPAAPTTQAAGQAAAGRITSPLDAYAVLWDKKFMEPYTAPVLAEAPRPTPVAPPATVAMPTFTPSGGTVTGPMDVRIAGAPGAKIRYTTDGSDPTPEVGQVYDKPIHLENPGTIKAIAYMDKRPPSPVAVANFNPPPPPPLKLVGLISYGDVHEAQLVNEQTKQVQYIQEGDPFDGGRLLLVLDHAAVAEMADGPRYVYRLGKSFKDKEILDPARQPDIAQVVELLVE